MSRPVILTAALTGALADRRQCPAIPYTATEIAAEARRSLEAGASIVHVHARQDDGRPAYDIESYRKIDEQLKSVCPRAIINYSTGAVGVNRETRVAHVRALRPAMAALNMGSMNYAIFSNSQKKFLHDHIFENPFGDIQYYLEAMKEAQTLPEMECFDCGHINNAEPFRQLGLLPEKLMFSLVMGVLGGIPATPRNLLHQVESLPKAAAWQCIGIGQQQWSLLPVAVSLGGGVRVGLEDNFYLKEGEMARSNGDLVDKARRMVEDAGGRVATPEEAREILGIHSIAQA
ncbi:MAG: 3-keto-5-aminohexanoate cleavage protein [Candidatus Eremiobacteraeota bacterium]|nr:3-keto-5-aminohexanoate cleavage protein [Candidatus Eremiobacteraeota bacterium]MCW5868810.1 3-keto-5-aminohexanoate cleavage protein [Candidatus Eremiobacteraeota bacterium]